MGSLENLLQSRWLRSLGRRLQPSGAREAVCRNLVDNLPSVIFRADTSGTCLFVSSRWHELTGFTAEETVDRRLAEYIHPQDRAKFERYFAGIVSGGPPPGRQNHFRCVLNNGRWLWIEIHAHALSSDRVTEVIGAISDVTQRVQDEHLLRAKYRTLESLVATLPGMVYRCRNTENWTMEYINDGCRQLTGYSPDALVDNKTLAYAQLIHTYDRQRVWNEVQAALQESRPFDLEYRIVTANDEEKWVWERGKGNFSISGELLSLEGYVVDITKDKLAKGRLRHELLYDPVTALPNPVLFTDRLQTAIRKSGASGGHHFVVVLLQLDGYERLESSYDATTADRVVNDIARRLMEAFDPSASLSRLHKDRVALLLERPHDIKAINKIIRHVQERILLPFLVEEREIYATASVGVATSSTGYTDARHVLADADTALSRAKLLGGGRYEVFDLRVHARAAAQSNLETELEQAMRGNQLDVFWQPIVRLANRETVALEARLVWQHPKRGRLFAEDFVPNAEDTQLIIPLWEWMLAETCKQIASWRDLDLFAGVAFNVQISGRSLLDADAILRLGQHLDRSGLRSDTFALAIPEEVLNNAPGAIEDLLHWLQTKNIKLVLNEFGGGIAGLSMLRKMPVSMIKLDRRLTTNWSANSQFIAAILALAHTLGLRVVADCIDREEQTNALREIGVDLAQGDHISPPVDHATLLSIVENCRLDPA